MAVICLAFPVIEGGEHMVAKLLMRGMIVGLLAGLLAFGFARGFGEPLVDRAIQLEGQLHSDAHEHAHGAAGQDAVEEEEPELFSREVQSGIGLFTAVIVYGAGLGGLFSLVYAYAYRRVGKFGPRALSGLLALGGFISVILVPMLKYPANPPAVGEPETIGMRTALYLGMMALSLLAMVISTKVTRNTISRFGNWHASFLGALTFIVLIGVAMFFLPAINEVPAHFPADLLWNFRVASLGLQVIIWTVLGLAFGEWVERSQQGKRFAMI
jgi:predicted cobalt transporter CbtA